MTYQFTKQNPLFQKVLHMDIIINNKWNNTENMFAFTFNDQNTFVKTRPVFTPEVLSLCFPCCAYIIYSLKQSFLKSYCMTCSKDVNSHLPTIPVADGWHWCHVQRHAAGDGSPNTGMFPMDVSHIFKRENLSHQCNVYLYVLLCIYIYMK